MNPESTLHFCFVTWVTHNSRVSERMVDILPAEFISGIAPLILTYSAQIRIAELIMESRTRYGVSIVTFNVQPDHVHMLVKVTDETILSKQIGNIKGYTAHILRKELAIESRVWARKYNAQWIENDRHFENVKLYIDRNHEKHLDSWGKSILCGYGDEFKAIVDKLKE